MHQSKLCRWKTSSGNLTFVVLESVKGASIFAAHHSASQERRTERQQERKRMSVSDLWNIPLINRSFPKV